jgi:hypothetical protein
VLNYVDIIITNLLQIGIGMISRGEVALLIANKGVALGLLNKQYFGPIIV